MKKYTFFLLLILLTGCAASRKAHVSATPDGKQYVVILSMDAFRWDLAGRSHTPTLDSLARAGTYAEIYPVYPSNTFPSHYAMATGLHPDHHGVVNNNFYDRKAGRKLSVFDAEDVRLPGFWSGEPIWNTAERQGLTANIFMWPGSEVPIDGRQATVWTPYSSKPTYYERADWVIDAMTRPEAEIPELVMWYFEEPDATMHTYGPESPQAVARPNTSTPSSVIFSVRSGVRPSSSVSISSSRPTMAWPRFRRSATSTSCRCSTLRRSYAPCRAPRSGWR